MEHSHESLIWTFFWCDQDIDYNFFEIIYKKWNTVFDKSKGVAKNMFTKWYEYSSCKSYTLRIIEVKYEF